MKFDLPYSPLTNSLVDEYTVVQQSGIQGHGLFAKKMIAKGTVWWHARPQDIFVIQRDQYLTLINSFRPTPSDNPGLIEQFLGCISAYSYYDADADALIFCLDNARYVNHSPEANSAAGEANFSSMALRDIQPGEEITEDYSKYKKHQWHQSANHKV